MLVAIDGDGAVFLERRPERGIWGGLWCLPEFDSESAARSYAAGQFREPRLQPRTLNPVQHAFTHFDLEILPVLAECAGLAHPSVMEPGWTLWYNPAPARCRSARVICRRRSKANSSRPSPNGSKHECRPARMVDCVLAKKRAPASIA